MTDWPRDIYQLLDSVRHRPGMHGIGEGGKSFRMLRAFLSGLWWANLDAGEPPFWEFDWWACVHTDHFPTSKPFHWLARDMADDAAYHAWFALLDEYRQCRVVELARLPGTLARHRPAWQIVDGVTRPYTPPVADAIILGQFAPSSVFFAGEVFGERTVMLIHGFQPTLERTMQEAEKEWSIAPSQWSTLNRS